MRNANDYALISSGRNWRRAGSFICTRGDLLSGNIGRILRIHPLQAIFVDRIVLANFVASGITVWGEAMLPAAKAKLRIATRAFVDQLIRISPMVVLSPQGSS